MTDLNNGDSELNGALVNVVVYVISHSGNAKTLQHPSVSCIDGERDNNMNEYLSVLYVII